MVKEALVRKDAAYVGMIGSQTKKKVLKNWLEREDVAGEFKIGRALLVLEYEVAIDRASWTDIASINGGSPTAFERLIVCSLFFDQFASSTLKILGLSEAKGIL